VKKCQTSTIKLCLSGAVFQIIKASDDTQTLTPCFCVSLYITMRSLLYAGNATIWSYIRYSFGSPLQSHNINFPIPRPSDSPQELFP